MKNYEPNFKDPRVLKRITNAIQFVERYVFSTPVPVAQSKIHEHMARTDTAIGRYLKSQLLICVDEYYNIETHQCKKYIRNQEGLDALKAAIKAPTTISPELQAQLDTGLFEYVEKGNRFFNPIQYAPRKVKRPLLAANGYTNVYDIQCAAPTLFYQYAQRINRDLQLPAIEQYLDNRNDIRTDLSVKYNIPLDDVKQILTGLFQGALLSLDYRTRIFHILNGNYTLIRRLQSDQYLTDLRGDISSMWKTINVKLKQELNKKRITARDKAGLYRELEREVMSEIKKVLKRTGNKFLLEHDGWTSRDAVDVGYLIGCVRSNTGYVINIDWEQYI
jgi:hypothetical protein